VAVETLEPQPRIIRPGRPYTRLTFQLAATLLPRSGEAMGDVFAGAVESCLRWLKAKYAGTLPPVALEGRSFDSELSGQSIDCVAIPDDGLWTVRLVQPDAPYPGQEAVAGRSWTTEIALARDPEGVRFGTRVLCASLPYATAEVRLTRPRIVKDLATRFVLRDARPLEAAPWNLACRSDLDELLALLTSQERSLPVYLLTEADQNQLGLQTSRFLLDAEDLATRVTGMAYVATMPKALGYQWTEMVGKPWSAYLGAVRTYRPGLSLEEDSPTDHPRALAERVLAFQYRGLKAEQAFAEMLVDQAHRHVATMSVRWGPLRFLDDARIRSAELEREHAVDDAGRVAQMALALKALEEKVSGLEGEREVALSLATEAERDKVRAEDETRRLRTQLDVLRRAFQEKLGSSPDADLVLPKCYEEMDEWVDEHLAGRLVLHPRALRGLNEAAYEDVALVANALLLLANEYRATQLGEVDAHRSFDAGCKELGLRFGRSITRERAGEEGETYFVRFPPNAQSSQFLEFHLRKGSGKDPRHCLAIYFFWDEITRQIVVGWLPSHLENRMT
jgi:hypothetical protein